MTTDIQIIQQDIQNCRQTFERVASDPSMNFEREAGFALQLIEGNPFLLKVAKNNRQSVMNAVINVASIGISLNPARRQAYLVPRDGVVCLDIGYMGLLDLAMDTGSIRWAKSEPVYENDQFELSGIDREPIHRFKPFAPEKERGPIVGVYTVAKTSDGDYLTEVMTIEAVYEIRDRSAFWKAKKAGPWLTDEKEMIKKTCVKRAYKYWPKTERLDKAIHYLNTDGDQGIDDTQQPGVFGADEWIDRAQATNSKEQLEQVWKNGLAEIKKAGDRQAYEKFKAAVADHGEVLKAPIDGQVMPEGERK